MYQPSKSLIITTNLIYQVKNSTYALWTWHRNQENYGENNPGDQIYIVRQPHLCPSPSQFQSQVHFFFHPSLFTLYSIEKSVPNFKEIELKLSISLNPGNNVYIFVNVT